MNSPKKQSTTSSINSNLNQDDEREVMRLLGNLFQEDSKEINDVVEPLARSPIFAMTLAGVFIIAHGAIVLSLPPVLRGNGAPFLPTTSENMNRMFKLIKMQPIIQKKLQQQKLINSSSSLSSSSSSIGLKFVDLGSGDGRMVFRSAREPDLFRHSVGYEINPVLHMWALSRRLIQFNSFYNNTSFYRQDLWKVNLKNVDVIAVYGLFNVMDRLGVKIKDEANPGTIVVSNIFAIPGWTPVSVEKGVYLYSIPESLR